MRHAYPKTDANQGEIVAALRKAGASVQSLAAVGRGCPDLLVGWQGDNYLLEVKDGGKPTSGQKLTVDQVAWICCWRGSVHIVTSVEQALDILA